MVNFAKQRANDLLKGLIEQAKNGNPTICTYSFAYKNIFLEKPVRWSQDKAHKVIEITQSTPKINLPGLGYVHLDTFIVSKKNRKPGKGHWKDVKYKKEDWNRVLGKAQVID